MPYNKNVKASAVSFSLQKKKTKKILAYSNVNDRSTQVILLCHVSGWRKKSRWNDYTLLNESSPSTNFLVMETPQGVLNSTFHNGEQAHDNTFRVLVMSVVENRKKVVSKRLIFWRQRCVCLEEE